jgi:hypothetical protein
METIKFATFPFTHKGINFVSRISEKSRHLPMIMLMGEEFIQMNKDAIDELINLDEVHSMKDLDLAIQHINEGGTEMFLELAGDQ